MGFELGHQGFDAGLQVGAHPRDAGDADQIGEAAAAGMDAGQALWWGGGGHQQHQVEAMGGRQGREGLGFFQGQIGHHQTGGAGGSGLLTEALHAPVEQGIAVRE